MIPSVLESCDPYEGAVHHAHGAAASLACRFAFDGAAGEVLHAALEADMQAARLTPLFRAYYLVRSLVPLPLRQSMQRMRQPNPAPDWYLPIPCLRALDGSLAAASCGGITTLHPWPDGNEFAFVLTHDVETADGLRRVMQIAELEEQLGLRSSWNVVPFRYPIDEGVLQELHARGFEIGVHGFNHDGKLFFSRATFDFRAERINEALRAWGAVGFRAPMVHRNLAWLQALEIEYDASCFDVDPYQAMPGGVGGVWPFMAGRFVELPYTLPQDHTLFVALGERDGRIWHQKLRAVAALRGMALLITHPDYLDSPCRLDAYRRLLENARESAAAWCALPKDVAAWWRQRDASNFRQEADGSYRVEGPAAKRGRVTTVRATSSKSINPSVENMLEWNRLASAPSPEAARNQRSNIRPAVASR